MLTFCCVPHANIYWEGHGVYTSIDGDLYRGSWRRDVQHGRGVYVWPDGQMYTGDYVDGVRSGKGYDINIPCMDGAIYFGLLTCILVRVSVLNWTKCPVSTYFP